MTTDEERRALRVLVWGFLIYSFLLFCVGFTAGAVVAIALS